MRPKDGWRDADIAPAEIELRFKAASVVIRRASHIEVGYDYMARPYPWW